jgi:1-deoxy-D-xylulose-5-phosphate reductoisomerase
MDSLPRNSTRRLILLGSTGSIGTSTLEVVEHLRCRALAEFEVVGLAAGANAAVLREQAERLGVNHVAIADEAQAAVLGGISHVYAGPDAALQMIEAVARPGDLVLGAMVGSAGVPATIAAIQRGCDIALANKETLVAAGAIVMPLVRKHGVRLLPVDSEHSAIFQCLLAGRSIDEVRRLVLTASGGPFRLASAEEMERATVQQALAHPTWSMGRKITIDSATLMNKALEVIEAHWLFGLPADKIDVIIHPQSTVHSFVEFVDGSVLAQLGPPDMRTPIQYALTWPHRAEGCSRAMDWTSLRRMDFSAVDHDRFPAVQLAYDVIRLGPAAGAVLNAANEAAVAAFLAGRAFFGRITQLVREALGGVTLPPVKNLDDVLRADREARDFVERRLAESSEPEFSRSAKPAYR